MSRWQLIKGSKKCVCPQCGKKTLVPFVLSEDNKTMAGEEFGRCDREQKCGYYKYPATDNDKHFTPQPKPIVEEKPIIFRNDVVKASPATNLFTWAAGFLGRDEAWKAWQLYRVGAMRSGEVLWWQISTANVVRAGKWMRYDDNGHRSKLEGIPSVGWLHKLPEAFPFFAGVELRQCLFGEHLLGLSDNRPIAVVESEKTAVMMSAIDSSRIWLACGGAQNLKNEERISVLRGRDVTLVPDEGQFVEWGKISAANGWKIADDCVGKAEGCDILDLQF